MRIELEGRTALLIGAENAVGDTLARMLADSGARVVRAAGFTGASDDVDNVTIFAPPMLPADVTAVCAAFAETLARRRGRILVVGSARGLVPTRGMGDASVDAAAVLAAARVAAMELAGSGIAVNALALGAISAAEPDLVSHAAVRRAGSTNEVASVAAFLLDPENTYMTGQVLAVDGGWSAGFVRDF